MRRSKNRLYVFPVVLTFTVSCSCFAAASDWNGTWKLNDAKSQLGGETETITRLANGIFHDEAKGRGSIDFACDGKEYPFPAVPAASITCTGSDADGYDEITRVNGRCGGRFMRAFLLMGRY